MESSTLEDPVNNDDGFTSSIFAVKTQHQLWCRVILLPEGKEINFDLLSSIWKYSIISIYNKIVSKKRFYYMLELYDIKILQRLK